MKEFAQKYLPWIIIGVLIVILLLSLDKCHSTKSMSEMDAEFYRKQRQGLLDSFQTFQNEVGQKINYQEQIVASKNAIIGNLISENELKQKRITKLDARLSVVQKILVSNVLIPFSDTANLHQIIVVRDSQPHLVNCVETPLSFEQSSDSNWFVIKGVVDTNGVKIDSISFLSKPSFTIGLAKAPGFINFMKPPKATVFYQDENPYAKTLSMSNVKVKYEEKFYEKKWFWFLMGNATGAGIIAGIVKGIK
jgi:hypothetical protein